MTSTESDVVIRREGRAGRITMNRPKALNALTYPMVGEIWRALLAWRDDPAVELVILDGIGGRALCAGGDVRALYDAAREGSGFARRFWSEEYRLNALIGRYPKPYVAIMEGIVMGGGIGLSAHGSHRIVTDSSQLAMPETGIGLIPDVGGTWLLSRAPGEIGTYFGLVGERMRAAGAIYSGFADVFVPLAQVPALVAELCDSKAGAVDDLIARHEGDPGRSELASHAAEIDRAFRFDRVEAIRDALAGIPTEWASKTLAELGRRSPKALKVTLAALRNARRLPSLAAALDAEYRLTVRLYEDGEFIEGVRALIVDKDKQPRWKPARLEDYAEADAAAMLRPLPADEELGLAREAGNG